MVIISSGVVTMVGHYSVRCIFHVFRYSTFCNKKLIVFIFTTEESALVLNGSIRMNTNRTTPDRRQSKTIIQSTNIDKNH